MKKVLVLCTGNSCRSIIAEALINDELKECVFAKSAGVKAKGEINPNAVTVLKENNIWKNEYHSKDLSGLFNEDFDLVVTVCDHANETCPIFPKPVEKIHVGFEDPDGKGIAAFRETFMQIHEELVPIIKGKLCN